MPKKQDQQPKENKKIDTETYLIKLPPISTRIGMRIVQALGKPEKAVALWEKSMVAQEEEVRKKIAETRENAEKCLMMFEKVYVLEDEQGKPYTEQRIQRMTHAELLKLLDFYLNELRKDVGMDEKDEK